MTLHYSTKARSSQNENEESVLKILEKDPHVGQRKAARMIEIIQSFVSGIIYVIRTDRMASSHFYAPLFEYCFRK